MVSQYSQEMVSEMGRFKNGSQIHEVVEEIADVEIMMSQLRLIFGNGCVDGAKSDKLLRPLSRVVEGEEAGKKNG